MNQKQYRKKAQNSWLFWRLVLDGNISYSDANKMDIEEIMEANAALDILIEEQRKGAKK